MIVSIVALILLLLVGIAAIVIRARKSKEHLEQVRKHAEETRNLLDSQANSRLHDFKKIFLNLQYVNLVKSSADLNEYVRSCGEYLKDVLNRNAKQHGPWTVEREWQLMMKYFKVANVLDKQINIERNIAVDDKKVKFESEILASLLDNSIHHGFKNINREFSFKVSIYKEGDLLHVDVSDNGRAIEADKYISEEDGLHALKIMKEKMEAIAVLHPSMKDVRIPFSIRSEVSQSTTIKIIMPYEEI